MSQGNHDGWEGESVRNFKVNIKQNKCRYTFNDMTTKKGSHLDKIVSGYIRESEKLLQNHKTIIRIIPEIVSHLCMTYAVENKEHTYFGIYDDWHSSIESNSSNLFPNEKCEYPYQELKGKKNTKESKNVDVVYLSQTGFSSGVHEIVIKCINLHPNDKIGICQYAEPDIKNLGKIFLYNYRFGQRYYWWNHTLLVWRRAEHYQKIENCKVWQTGDIIKMILDCDNWTLSYMLNDKVIVKSLKIAPNITYYHVVTHGDTKCQYRHILPESSILAKLNMNN